MISTCLLVDPEQAEHAKRVDLASQVTPYQASAVYHNICTHISYHC